ncbi:MAG: aspartate aminotransferase family protein [Chitinispirillales bacterium]|jgi:4-aminobutyrate aminotransferase-like enzyme|nr:aspartate aminotransferase family protein [Chitinispirillales bacterium]
MFEKSRKLLDDYAGFLYPVLDFCETVTVRGEGCYVWDADGNKILDLNSGQFCSVFGHSDPQVAETVYKTALKIQDTNTAALSEEVLFAAKRIHDICPEMNARSFFLSTGAEANECCLRYARHLNGGKPGVISFDNGYHGLTHGTKSHSTGRRHVNPPLNFAYVTRVPRMYNETDLTDRQIDEYIEEFRNIVHANAGNIAIAIFEPVVSSGGMYIPSRRYFKKIREICTEYNIFLAFDECQTGFGRTGTWFYYQQLECTPDFLVCAKGIGLGYPVSVVIFNGNTFSNPTSDLQHFCSHQNDPFAGALVSHGIDTIEKNNLMEHIGKMGVYLLDSLKNISSRHVFVQNPRGVGLMCAFDIGADQSDIAAQGILFCKRALENNIMLQPCNGGKTIRLLPSYCVTENDIDFLCLRLKQVLKKYY